MCGIAGFLDPRADLDEASATARVRAMADTLRHRGPDDAGTWVDATAGVALGHRRLAIIDVSPTGHQPMVSASGRFVIAFNGEIYNFAELRAELGARVPLRGHSDTEVLIEAIAAWGVPGALARARGMFAIALWDRSRRELVLARDRLGEKPLYYGLADDGRTLVFASELKALRRHPGFVPTIDRSAVAQFFRYGYVCGPHAIYTGVRKLPPGSWLALRGGADAAAAPTPYWSLRTVAETPPLALSPRAATDQLEAALSRAVRAQMVADVPLGAFLSGGIDSSTVVALMQAQSARPVRTFTVGFHEAGYDEAPHARAIAAHLGTEHTEVYVSPGEAQDVIPNLATVYDEPFADSSQIPTFLVARVARRHVTVSLSGDGGDELFAGYTRYAFARRVWRILRCVPRPARRVAAGALAAVPSRHPRLRAARELLGEPDADHLYAGMMSTWRRPAEVVIGVREAPGIMPLAPAAFASRDQTERSQYADTLQYLPDDILVKVDRAAMAVSLETRVPLLDPAVVALAWRLPRGLKVRARQGKWILREVLARHVPRRLFERPKMGFGVPVGAWIRGPLRPWAEELLAEDRLRREGYLDPAPIRRLWEAHRSGRVNAQYLIWVALMWEAWLASSTRA
jgi:asparagine synthase (glutamine-hydrolysing)